MTTLEWELQSPAIDSGMYPCGCGCGCTTGIETSHNTCYGCWDDRRRRWPRERRHRLQRLRMGLDFGLATTEEIVTAAGGASPAIRMGLVLEELQQLAQTASSEAMKGHHTTPHIITGIRDRLCIVRELVDEALSEPAASADGAASEPVKGVST